MSIFKKIKDELGEVKEKAMDAYREVDLMNELCEHLRQIGINATLLEESKSLRESMIMGFQGFPLGSVKVEGRNIDLVQVDKRTHTGGGGESSGPMYDVYFYHYVVRANVEGLEDKLKAEVKTIKKGFLSSEVVDFKWEGGELAQMLNADTNLKNMLLRKGLNQLPNIEVKPRGTKVGGIGKPPQDLLRALSLNQCVRITKQPKMPMLIRPSFGMRQRFGREEFPTREDFEIYDRIAQHIRSITNAQPS